MSDLLATRAAERAALALLTPAEADALAEAVRILDRVEHAAGDAGWSVVDSMKAMRLGKVSEAASVAEQAITHYLIAAAVSLDDPEADRALHSDDPDDEADDVEEES